MAFTYALDPTTPAGGEAAALGDDRIREFKNAMIERLQQLVSDYTTDPYKLKSGLEAAGTLNVRALTPVADNTYALGTSLLRFSDLRVVTATFAGAVAGITTLSVSSTATMAAINASGLVTANAGLTVASGQTLTISGVTVTGLTAASVGVGTFPSGAYVFQGAVSGITTLAGSGAVSGFTSATFSSSVTTSGTGTIYPDGDFLFSKSVAGGEFGLATTAATGSPVMDFDHRGASNTGSFRWRIGTDAGTTLGTLSASGLVLGTLALSGITTLATSGTITSGAAWILTGSTGGVGGSNRYIGSGGSSTLLLYNVPTGGTHSFQVNEGVIGTLSATGFALNTLALSGITTLAGGGAISGFTTLSLSNDITITASIPGVQLVASNEARIRGQKTGTGAWIGYLGWGNDYVTCWDETNTRGVWNYIPSTGVMNMLRPTVFADAVSGITTLATTGAISSVVTAGTSGLLTTAAGGGDAVRLVPQAAGSGSILQSTNNGITDFEPFGIFAETITLNYRTGVATTAAGITLGAAGAVTFVGTLSGITTLGTSSTITTTASGSGYLLTTTADTTTYGRVTTSSGGTPRTLHWGVFDTGTSSGAAFVGSLTNHNFILTANNAVVATFAPGGALTLVAGVSGITTLAGTDAISGFTSAAFSGVLSTTSSLAVAATQRIYLDGVAASGDTYLQESGANTLRVVVGSYTAYELDGTAAVTSGQTLFNNVTYHNGTSSAQGRITLGAADSGGAGFKVLRLPN